MPTFHETRQYDPISIFSSAMISAPLSSVKSPIVHWPFSPMANEHPA